MSASPRRKLEERSVKRDGAGSCTSNEPTPARARFLKSLRPYLKVNEQDCRRRERSLRCAAKNVQLTRIQPLINVSAFR